MDEARGTDGGVDPMAEHAPPVDLTDPFAPRLDIFKALGDNTRYAIYLELARSAVPLATAEIAELLDLHVNTVRPHLERMRDVGLLQVDTGARGGVGRLQHRYSLAPGAPALGLEPSPFPVLSTVLMAAASQAGVDPSELADAAHHQGRVDARRCPSDVGAVEALVVEQARMGFDPMLVDGPHMVTVAFTNCPFEDLAREHPDLVCAVHCGLIEGLVDEIGDARVDAFRPLVDRNPCQVDLVAQ